MINKQHNTIINVIFTLALLSFITLFSYELITHPESSKHKMYTMNKSINNSVSNDSNQEINQKSDQIKIKCSNDLSNNNDIDNSKNEKIDEDNSISTGLGSALLVYSTLSAF